MLSAWSSGYSASFFNQEVAFYCLTVGTCQGERRIQRTWVNSFCELLVTGQRKAGGGFPRLEQAGQKRHCSVLLEENGSVCLANLRSQVRLLENWSEGVWGRYLLIGKLQ